MVTARAVIVRYWFPLTYAKRFAFLELYTVSNGRW